MANRFPLIVDSSALQIKELPANDNIDLSDSGIVNATSIGATTINISGISTLGIVTSNNIYSSGVVTATNFYGGGSNLSGIVTSLVAGTNITLSGATGEITIDAAGGGGGSGQFNTGISSQVGYDITSSLAAAKTLPATAGKTYIIQSVQITNVSTAGTDARVTGKFAFNGAETVEFAHKIPVPYRGSVELLKQPQVLNPSDSIQFQGFFDSEIAGSNLLNAFVVYEEQDSTDYKGVGAGLSVTTPVGVFTSTTYPSVIQSVRLTNISDIGDYAATVSWTTGAGTTQAYIAKDFIVPKNSSVELLDAPKRVDAGHIIRAQVGVSTTIHIQVSAKNIV
jgi:hypothetical protein